MNKLIILRGVPGCGKSTLAEYLAMLEIDLTEDGIPTREASEIVCTADDFFMHDGYYHFNASKLGEAHASCQFKCKKLLESGEPLVIVANTTTTEKEIKPYMEMAEKNGYMVFSLIVENRHGGENSHEVPEFILDKMVSRFSIKLKN